MILDQDHAKFDRKCLGFPTFCVVIDAVDQCRT
jgi:hypothetical protein